MGISCDNCLECRGACLYDAKNKKCFDTCLPPKELSMKAEDYEILRDCTLDTLIEKNACPEAVEWYVVGELKRSAKKDKLQRVIANHPQWLEWLIHEDIIKKIERKPEVGDVWAYRVADKYLLIEQAKKGWKAFCIETETYTGVDVPYKHWKYIGKLRDMIKDKP